MQTIKGTVQFFYGANDCSAEWEGTVGDDGKVQRYDLVGASDMIGSDNLECDGDFHERFETVLNRELTAQGLL